MIPKVILFDLDDTLIYEVATDSAVIVNVIRRLVPAARGNSPELLVEAVHSAARTRWQESPASAWGRSIGTSSIEGLYGDYSGDDPHLAEIRRYLQETNYRERVWREALHALDVPTTTVLAQLVAAAFAAERPRRHEPIPDAREILERLGRECRLVLLTNGAPGIQRAKLAGSGFAPHFEAIVVSGEFGVGKPDPAIFEHALKLAGVAADETVMIGNSFANDVIGAQNAGIKAVWFNLDHEPIPATAHPWRTITTLSEIAPLLGSAARAP